MNGLSPRMAAWEALCFWQENDGWVLDGLARSCAGLEPRDRSLAYEIALGTCRRHARLLAAVKTYAHRPPQRKAMLLVELSLYQMFFMDRVPAHAVLDAAVRLARTVKMGEPTAKFINAMLRRAQREGLPPLPEEPLERLAQEYSAPVWLLKRWLRQQTPEQVEERLRTALATPVQWIRVNIGKTTVARLQADLQIEPLSVFADRYLALPPGTKVLQHPLFAAGHFSFQNPASWLVTRLLDVRVGDRVWDACAAPGGKTALMAEEQPGAHFLASDAKVQRLASMDDLPGRLQLQDIRVCVADALKPPFGPEFDRVLLDVPCSNLGVMGRRPEVLQRLSQKECDSLPDLQYNILEASAKCVAEGGLLVYATCSPEHGETFAVVQRFLRLHPEFVQDDASDWVPLKHVQQGCLLVRPNAEGLDQFFAARLRRKA